MLIPLDNIKPYSKNPKQEFTKAQYKALLNSVKEYGFIRPLQICKDFENNTNNYICADGNTALQLLKDINKTEIECNFIEKITNDKSMMKFIASISITKKPLYSKMVDVLGTDLSSIIGRGTKMYETPDVDKMVVEAKDKYNSVASETQSQYFITLPTDTIKKLKSLTKSKLYKHDKTEAIITKIEKMNELSFISKLFEVIL